MKDKKIMILNLLKKEKELSTSKIGYKISSNHYKTEEILGQLEREKKIKKRQGKNGIYWSLR